MPMALVGLFMDAEAVVLEPAMAMSAKAKTPDKRHSGAPMLSSALRRRIGKLAGTGRNRMNLLRECVKSNDEPHFFGRRPRTIDESGSVLQDMASLGVKKSDPEEDLVPAHRHIGGKGRFSGHGADRRAHGKPPVTIT